MTTATVETTARVIGFSMSTDAELGKMMHAAAAKAGVKHVAWVRAQMIKGVNDAGLQRADGSDWKYVAEDKVSLKEQNAKLLAQIAELQEQVAKAAFVPTPPTMIANAETGELEERAAA